MKVHKTEIDEVLLAFSRMFYKTNVNKKNLEIYESDKSLIRFTLFLERPIGNSDTFSLLYHENI